MPSLDFAQAFERLTDNTPFPWQSALYERFIRGDFPSSCSLPTGLGKTAVIHLWLLALAQAPTLMPRRLVYVVNRRTVVDQSTDEARKLRERLTNLRDVDRMLRDLCADPNGIPLAISTLRGQFADNREWSSDPARPAIIAGTVDMIGSRLLFSGYGCGFKSRPLHAGFLGQDALLVHDEAHLEPAFQELLTAIQREQRDGRTPDFRPLRVMELTATSRASGQPPFVLGDQDYRNDTVRRRIFAKKGIAFHEPDLAMPPRGNGAKDAGKKSKRSAVAEKIADLAAGYGDSQEAILIFVRTLDDVETVVKKLKAIHAKFEVLTGTIRGKERDELVQKPQFLRFRPQDRAGGQSGTVYLVCTSAGEVGIDISADHLVCDLTPFESMAQRLGRVNRRGGDEKKASVEVVHEPVIDETEEYDQRRALTLALLRELPLCEWDVNRHDASPYALGMLPVERRQAAFSPQPITLTTSDMLFDSWVLTTIRDALPGRPLVEPYLHGLVKWQPPETYVAWRLEVGIITGDLLDEYNLEELLDDYPLKPHELLRDRTDRVFKHLQDLAKERGDAPVWLMAADGSVNPMTLGKLATLTNEELTWKTVLLPPAVGGLTEAGMLGTGQPADSLDVADEWWDEDRRRRRVRLWDNERIPEELGPVRLVRTIDTTPEVDDEQGEEDRDPRRLWKWYVRPLSAEQGSGPSAPQEQSLKQHHEGAEKAAMAFATKLLVDPGLRTAVQLAARWHDLGKDRALWQTNMGNRDYPRKVIAKTGHNKPPQEWIRYRHEFGSLLDVLDEKQAFFEEFQSEPEEVRDLILHLIAAHHGRGRPHFSPDEFADPLHREARALQVAAAVPRRFARLQRRYGRWGLAWLESLVRAADAEATVNASRGAQ